MAHLILDGFISLRGFQHTNAIRFTPSVRNDPCPTVYVSGMFRKLNFFVDVKPKFTEVIAMPFIEIGSHTELEVNLYNLALINPLVNQGLPSAYLSSCKMDGTIS